MQNHSYSSHETANTQINTGSGTHTEVSVDVAIVGAGPIGLSMCNALKQTGLRVALIEKQSREQVSNPQPDGREIAITHTTKATLKKLNQWQLLEQNPIHYLKRAEVYSGTSQFALGFDVPDQSNKTADQQIDTLGYLLSNCYIRKAAYDAMTDDFDNAESHVQAFFSNTITRVDEHADSYSVEMFDNDANTCKITTKLLLAADSRTSFMRKKLGISADMHDFGRSVLLCRCTHTHSNKQIAHEAFYYGKTLAVLPLGEYESSMVITVDNSKVNEIADLNDSELAHLLSGWLDGSLGEITITSQMHSYPLLGVHARRFYGNRCALIGDAAVGMHPVTAHGYNLGMESVMLLTELIESALANNEDFASEKVLSRYHAKHSLKTRAMYHGTNAIVKLYTNDSMPARIARDVGLRLGAHFPPIKKLITKQLTG